MVRAWIENRLKVMLGVFALAYLPFSLARSSEGKIDLTEFVGRHTQKSSVAEAIERLQKMEQLRASAQSSLENLLKKGSNVDLQLRFAELIVQRGKDLEQFSLEIEFAGDSKKAKALKDESHALMRKGLSLHSALLSKAANHPMIPKVYLGMARTEYSLMRKAAALESARKGLISLKAHKNSKSLGDTELVLRMIEGDSSFDLSKAAEARIAYTAALNLAEKNSMEQAYLLYKSAWVEFNLKDSEKALSYLDELFKVSGDKYSLKQEAVQDFALFLSDLPRTWIKQNKDDFQGVDQYLEKQSDSQTAEVALRRMAGIFANNGRRLDAIDLQEYLISKNPSHPKNAERALDIVSWTHHLADKSKLTEKYFWMLDYFGPRAVWYSNQAKAPQVQREASEKIEASIRKYATDLHSQLEKEKSSETKSNLELTVSKLYDAHIQNFNRENDVPRAEVARVHFYRAEIHRSRKEWSDAGFRYDHYLRTLGLVPKDQMGKIDDKLKDEAIWGSVFVWAKAVEKDPKHAIQLMAAADRFLEAKPKDAKAPQVLLDAAYIEQKTQNNAVALKRLERLVKNYPKTPQAKTAVDTILDILNKEQDWINLAQNARMYLDSISVWSNPQDKIKMQVELNKILSQTEAKACEALAKEASRKLEAALCYEKFATGFEKDVQAPKALLLSAELYDELKDPTAAVSVLEKLVKKYPDTDFATRGFSRLAGVYEKAFEFEKAVQVYDALLSKSNKLPEREKVLARHLDLVDRLGMNEQFDKWLRHKGTPETLRRDIEQRAQTEDLAILRGEEARWGWKDGKLASATARKIQAKLEKELASGRISMEREMEIRRIRGIELKFKNQLDKADAEWLAGLKIFWKMKDRTSMHWELAARTRLEQAALWEQAFKSTSIMKNPAKKAELFKKLEGWYAEVIEMKAPVAALAALWKSAELNIAFANDVRSSPIPPELLAPGMESQLKTYEKLVFEKTEPLKKKAINIVEKIALKAREWKVISPVVLTSLKMTSELRSGMEIPGSFVRVEESEVLKFPWAELPRWVDLNAEQGAWEEWKQSEKDLLKALRNEKGRSASRRAAFVLFTRNLSRNSVDISKWVKTFQDKAGIQLRIQAYADAGDFSKAILYLEQYESFFGQDAFAEYQWGHIEWARGNYSSAYSRWVRPVYGESRAHFRNQYWLEGWGFLLDEMIDGWPSQSRRKEIFAKLKPLVKTELDQVLLAKLCVDGAAECEGQFKTLDGLAQVLALGDGDSAYSVYSYEDGRSLWTVKRQAISEFISRNTLIVKRTEDLKPLREAASAFYALIDRTEKPNDIRQNYSQLKNRIDARQDSIEGEARNRLLVTQKQGESSL